MPRQRKRGIKGAGSVYRRKNDGLWVGSFMVEETGKRKYLYADNEKDAYDLLQKAQQEQKQGILATGPKQKLETFLIQWLDEVHKPKIRPTTYARHRSVLYNHILPALGSLQLQKLTTQKVQAFYTAKLKAGQSTGSVHIMHNVLSKSLDTAVQWRLISYNPCKGISLPNQAKRKPQSLTEEQARKLLETVRGHKIEAVIALALSTGMREGELLALRWDDINLEQGIVDVHRTVTYLHHGFQEGDPKTKSGKRKIMVPSRVCIILQEHKRMQEARRTKVGTKWQDHNLVFCNRFGGFSRANDLVKNFYELLEEAHLPKIHIHDLRHSAATLMGAMKVNPKVIQEMLGHSSLQMTMDIYSHVLPSMQKEAITKMEFLFQPPDEEASEEG